MELEDFKSDFKNAAKGQLSRDSIQKMILENNHPVLRGIKIQLIAESVLWAVFLAVYHDFFDGHLRSPVWNILLILSIILVLVHNVLGYRVASHPVSGENILSSLGNYLSRLRKYSAISILSRVAALAVILGFFVSTVRFTEDKYWSLGILLLIFPVQIFLLRRVWRNRIKKVDAVYRQLQG
jgi:succinate dehydrogenase hydrophobic anchor subunit